MLARLLGVRIFDMEVTSRCNLECRFCPREQLPATGHMSQETFTGFLDKVPLGSTDALSFVGIGEPLMNPLVPDFIRQAKSRYPKAATWITTNGTLLTQKTLHRLLDAGVDTIDVSFNGLDATSYENLMRGARFEKTLANVEAAAKAIRQRQSSCRLQVNYVVTSENAQREEEIQSFWRSRGITHFRPQHLHDRGGTLATSQGLMPSGSAGLRGKRCDIFDMITFVSWRGEVHYCCHDIKRQHRLGSIADDDWKTISARKKSVTREGKWVSMCDSCTDPLRHSLCASLDEKVRAHIGRQLVGVFSPGPKTVEPAATPSPSSP